MKTLKTLIVAVITLISVQTTFSQNITPDTTLATKYYVLAKEFKNNYMRDSALFYVEKAQKLYIKHLGENSLKNSNCLNLIGLVYNNSSMFDIALVYYQKSLQIKLELLGEKHVEVAKIYNNIALVFKNKSEYDKSLEYFQISLEIYLEIIGENNTLVAMSYHNIGNVYNAKTEYDKALEYYQKSLEIRLKLFGVKHIEVAKSYINIGSFYINELEYDKALEYFQKSVEISLELFGEKHIDVALSYNNIGYVYFFKKEYDKALEYYQKSLDLGLELFGEKNTYIAVSYNNFGDVYYEKSEFDKAFEYFFKSLEIRLELLGEKHSDVASSYNDIGNIFFAKSSYDKALNYYQKDVASCLYNFNDTTNVYTVPEIKNYLDWNELFDALQAKAEIFADTIKTLDDISNSERLQISLKHYQASDTLITQVRKQITTQSDKISLGEMASKVYKGAVDVCMDIVKNPTSFEYPSDLKEVAFYFSERNKSSVLLEALAGSDALKFAGIPQELLEKEHDLSIDIASYTNLKNNAENDSIANIWSNRLFDLNRTYDSLIVAFETTYPNYYQLKYNNSPVKVEQIQEILDKKTAMLSYFILDSSIVIYAITKKGFEIYKTPLIENFVENIENFTLAIQSSKKTSVLEYKDLAFKLYNQLFPTGLLSNLTTTKVENLIIIPDGVLATIPFESLLTEDYTKEWTSWSDKTYFSEMQYLIKKYAISYSYSATLFYNTFPKENNKEVEIKDLNDFIAFAPVFDNEGIAGTTEVSSKLLKNLDENIQDSTITTRGFLNGNYITPLPGSLTEVENIFKMFDNAGLKAIAKTHNLANEDFIKSGELSNYKYIHFATHGFVNTENPELSGILLAQDTSSTFESYEDIYGNVAQQNDGILYQSEIYNLELNSDLVVLSACETGLGKITSGEGVLGLTRALLYAGTKNIIVSLWSVSDASTSQLMINFYDNLLKSKKQTVFSKDLQKAKLKLIEEGTYAHPFYWSPFILIGK